MAGTLTISTLSDGTNSTSSTNCIQGSAKAWAKFQGGNGNTGGVILGSYNVSSITVNGTGDYTVNFTNALANANYSAVANCWNGGGNARSATAYYNDIATTSAVRISTWITTTNTSENQKWVSVSVSSN